MYLTVPFMVFATICFCVSAKVPVIDTVLYLVLGFVLLAFSTSWGCVCGVKHMRLDWENEIEVVKQSAALVIYLLPNMFVGMALMAGVVYLGMFVDHKLLACGFILVISLLAALSYKRVMVLAKR
jgi:ABC-2 type transport system permease protein